MAKLRDGEGGDKGQALASKAVFWDPHPPNLEL